MKRLLVLGAGTAGTMVVNKLHGKLPVDQWQITVVDRDDEHLYQPGLLLLPFGMYEPSELVKSRQQFLPRDVELVRAEIERVDADRSTVVLADGRELPYDQLVVATGTSPRPDQRMGRSSSYCTDFPNSGSDGGTKSGRWRTPAIASSCPISAATICRTNRKASPATTWTSLPTT